MAPPARPTGTPTGRSGGSEPSAHVQSLGRGLSVIEAFDADHPAMTLSDVARRTGLTRATARRFLLTLVDLGYVRSDGKRFTLAPQVLRLGHAYLSSMGLPALAQPHLETLSAQLHESVSVAVLDGSDIVYVARVATRRIMTVGISVGTRFPAYATSMGRVLLAALPTEGRAAALLHHDFRALTDRTITSASGLAKELARVRDQGYSLVDRELEPGLRSLAVPITGAAGEVVAALNVSTQAHADSEDLVETHLPALRVAAAAVSRDLHAGRSGRH